jgi:APA family basic amino acid/polyamine antiporter
LQCKIHPMKKIEPRLNLLDVIMLVSGSMIGSGIFIVSADMMRTLGSPFWVLMCWLLSGVITLFAALSYGELAAMMPEAGGQFIFLKRAFGNLTAFVYGWTVFLVIQTGVIAAVAVAFAKYLGVLIPAISQESGIHIGTFFISVPQLVAIASIIVLTAIHTQGIKNGTMIQRVFTASKLLALFGLIVLAFTKLGSDNHFAANFKDPLVTRNYGPENPNGISITGFHILEFVGIALIGALFSSDAWNNVTFLSAEIKNPKRNLPLGLAVGVFIVTILYILANVAYFILLPALGDPNAITPEARGIMFADNDRVATAALFTFFGNTSIYIMAILIVISTFGCNNGLILAGSRLFQSMADAKLFFNGAAFVNKHNVPSKSLWIQCIWASILCLTGSYGQLLKYATFSSLLFYVVTIIALFVLRKKEPDTPRPYKAWGYPIIPALYILITSLICLDILIFDFRNSIIGVGIIALGIPVYFFFRNNQNVQTTSK